MMRIVWDTNRRKGSTYYEIQHTLVVSMLKLQRLSMDPVFHENLRCIDVTFFVSFSYVFFFYRLYAVKHFSFQCSHGECPTVETTETFIRICENFVQKNPTELIGKFSLIVFEVINYATSLQQGFAEPFGQTTTNGHSERSATPSLKHPTFSFSNFRFII